MKPRGTTKPARLAGTERREAILRAALPLFAHRGFYGVSTKEIASGAGISEALIFKHFPTKRALYKGLYAYCARAIEFDQTRLAALGENGLGAAQLLYFVLRSVLSQSSPESLPTFRLFCHSCLEDGEFAALVLAGPLLREVLAKFGQCLRAAIRNGDAADLNIPPERLFWFARNIASQVFLHQLARRPALIYKADNARLFQDIVLFSLHGIGFTPAALKRYASAAQLAQWEKDPAHSLLALRKRRRT